MFQAGSPLPQLRAPELRGLRAGGHLRGGRVHPGEQLGEWQVCARGPQRAENVSLPPHGWERHLSWKPPRGHGGVWSVRPACRGLDPEGSRAAGGSGALSPGRSLPRLSRTTPPAGRWRACRPSAPARAAAGRGPSRSTRWACPRAPPPPLSHPHCAARAARLGPVPLCLGSCRSRAARRALPVTHPRGSRLAGWASPSRPQAVLADVGRHRSHLARSSCGHRKASGQERAVAGARVLSGLLPCLARLACVPRAHGGSWVTGIWPRAQQRGVRGAPVSGGLCGRRRPP